MSVELKKALIAAQQERDLKRTRKHANRCFDNGKRITVGKCREFYDLFAPQGAFATSTQRKMFLFLLELAERQVSE